MLWHVQPSLPREEDNGEPGALEGHDLVGNVAVKLIPAIADVNSASTDLGANPELWPSPQSFSDLNLHISARIVDPQLTARVVAQRDDGAGAVVPRVHMQPGTEVAVQLRGREGHLRHLLTNEPCQQPRQARPAPDRPAARQPPRVVQHEADGEGADRRLASGEHVPPALRQRPGDALEHPQHERGRDLSFRDSDPAVSQCLLDLALLPWIAFLEEDMARQG
mmetsp:Transcript_55521/g.162238  ORF Transcript_55521/g.162238 Transcript_55521/m.162238 type:complete len:222 (-) Transcript_55521:1222-1887(-)